MLKTDVTVGKLSFSSDSQFLQTNKGLSDVGSLVSSAEYLVPRSIKENLFMRETWVVREMEHTLWLPSEYRAACIVVWKDFLVIGHRSDHVSFFRFDMAENTL